MPTLAATARSRLAHRLARDGVDPQSFMAIHLPTSVEHVVATLAAYKLGACPIRCLVSAPQIACIRRGRCITARLFCLPNSSCLSAAAWSVLPLERQAAKVDRMSEQFYGLCEPPFAVAPDVRFAVLSEAAQAMLQAVQHEIVGGSGGIVLLTGDSGSGKTLLAQCLLQRLAELDVRIARVLHSRLTSIELLQTVCDRLRVPLEPEQRNHGAALIEALSAFLMDTYAQGQRVLLLVDEAQNLSGEALEQLRLLTNLQTPAHKLIHILLLGTPVLEARLQSSTLMPLAQRVAARHALAPLTEEQTEQYVRTRLQVAGSERLPFTRLAMRSMHRYAGGMPGTLNRIAERALSLGSAANQLTIGEQTIQRAAGDVMPGHLRYVLRRYRWWWRGAALVLLLLCAWGIRAWLTTPAQAPVASVVDVDRAQSVHAEVAHMQKLLQADDIARMQAWSELLARWQVGSANVSVAKAADCNAVIFRGFNCVGGTGTLNQLRRFDRPMVLELTTPAGVRQVLLLGIGEKDVRLHLGASELDVSRQALATLWQGRFYAPFRLPANLPATLRRGDVGAAVAWLDGRLRRVDGDKAGAYRPAVFDAAMESRVRKLQQGFGIPDDGIVGPETYFALTSLDDAGPHLAHNVN